MCLQVTKCCFCISVNVGAKIIAVLSLVSSILTLLVYGGAALTLSPSWAHSKQCFYLIAAAITVCQLGFCCLLAYGTFWHKPRYLWPWLVTNWICCGVLVALSLLGVLLLTLQYYDDAETFDEISTMSTFYFMYAVILYYCTIIVNSRREQILQEEVVEAAESLMRRRHIPKSILV